MKNIFSDAETFKEALKAEVSARFGRDFEDAYPEERYLALGTLIRDQLGYSWKVTKKKCFRASDQTALLLLDGIPDGPPDDQQPHEHGCL